MIGTRGAGSDGVGWRPGVAQWLTDTHPVPVLATVGMILTVVGFALMMFGWYDIAGQSVLAKQLPFLMSASIPGAVLLLLGGILELAAVWLAATEQFRTDKWARPWSLRALIAQEAESDNGSRP